MHVAVIGLGRFGSSLARNLSLFGVEVIAIDANEENVKEIADSVSASYTMDATNEQELIKRGITEVDTVVIAIGENILTSILTTAILKRIGGVNIIARATNKVQADILNEIGARKIIYIEEEMAEHTAQLILSETTLDRHEVLKGYSFTWVMPPESFHGKTIEELDIDNQYGIQLIAIRSKQRTIGSSGETQVFYELNDQLSPNDIVTEDDTLLIFGSNDLITEFNRDIDIAKT
jgi:trk system potassium uptake protein